MRDFFQRTPEHAAKAFNALIMIFAAHCIVLIAVLAISKSFSLLALLLALAFLVSFGLVAYQIGYHPALAVIWSAALFIPWLNFLLFLWLLIKAKTWLRAQHYRIGFWGARPVPLESGD